MIELKRRKIEVIENSSDEKTHWNKIEGGSDSCFVCDGRFTPYQKKKQTIVLVGFHKITGDILLRHEHCESGSTNWIGKFGGRLDSRIKLPIKREKTEPKKIILKRRRKAE